MKKKMLLLKKRKAEMQLKMQAAAKKKVESDAAATGAATSGKSLDESDTTKDSGSTANPVTKTAAFSKPSSKSSSSLSPKLPPVQESMTEQDDKMESVEEKETPTTKPTATPASLTFGSSSTVAGLDIPTSAPLQSEPTCPKPSFFGASATAPASVFGSGTSAAFGSGATPAFGSQSAFGSGAKNSEEKAESPDASAKQPPASSSGTFLDLTPPGKSKQPAQFVFGKSTNITLPVPAPSPFGVFNQKAQAAPFGSSTFNTNPPFGAPAGMSEVTEKVDTKKERNAEDGEVEEGGVSAQKDPVAKKA
jgi:nucleoprotein TPR